MGPSALPVVAAPVGGLIAPAAAPAPAAAARAGAGAWGAAPQRVRAGNGDIGPNWSLEGFDDQSVRQVVRVSAGGTEVRIRVDNTFGKKPLRLAGATVARSARKAGARELIEGHKRLGPGRPRPWCQGRRHDRP
ncbi:hypothetical protein ACWDZ4_28680 [Streptomyces sp. NPDC003016]